MLELAIPSKTFILGEYAVLNGGQAVVACTKPNFKMIFSPSDSPEYQGFTQNTPTWQFIQDHQQTFKSVSIEFIDPHAGAGGFGASSAQFLGAYGYHCRKNNLEVSIPKMLDCFWKYHYISGIKPSGADLAAQFSGNLTLFNSQTLSCENLSWPFENLMFFIVKTPRKIATHQHLNDLKSFDSSDLNSIVQMGLEAIERSDEHQFIQSINDYQTALIKMNFCSRETQTIIQHAIDIPEILAAKGCGAMGADVMLFLAEKNNRNCILDFCAKHDMTMIADSSKKIT